MQNVEFSKALSVTETSIPGLLLLDLPVHGDARGWFKENWQREKMVALGLPDFHPVQNNISFNEKVGTTRGIHAEPWDKFVSVATGTIFGAWVDLREGKSFGTVFTATLDPSQAIFVPRGVGNAFQTLTENTAYVYLVNDHWSANAQSQYTFLNLADETAAIDWPISLEKAELSDKDRAHPPLAEVTPMPPKKTLILGANGQLGKALQTIFPHAETATRADLDLNSDSLNTLRNWSEYQTIINAAAYTDVDGAETPDGRRHAWATNVTGLVQLVKIAATHAITLVNVSSDYVFDGTAKNHPETEPFSPLGVYGQTKAAGDAIVSTLERHYTIRTSWVIGEGKNFVGIMQSLAEKGVSPSVVDDQFGALSYTGDIAATIAALLRANAPYGTYNVTSGGAPRSWAQIAREVFAEHGHDPERVTGVSTAEYYVSKTGVAPRPLCSVLPLDKVKAALAESTQE